MKKLGEVLKEAGLTTDLEVEVESYDYDCGDKRSYGSLGVKLKVGELKVEFSGSVGSSGGVEAGNSETASVNGEEVEFDCCPSVEVPHYYSGVRTCNRWEERANDTLVEDFGVWLAEELAGAE